MPAGFCACRAITTNAHVTDTAKSSFFMIAPLFAADKRGSTLIRNQKDQCSSALICGHFFPPTGGIS
jgi:hypothetical protein